MNPEGRWPADDPRRIFVDGAKWWEFHSTGFTMWRRDIDLAEAEAERRFPYKPEELWPPR